MPRTVEILIDDFRKGADQAADALFVRYYRRLVQLARHRLTSLPRRVVDEEDLAAAALASLFTRLSDGSYPEARNDEDLWRILATIVEHKLLDEIRRQRANKRGNGKTRGESIFFGSANHEGGSGFDRFAGEDLSKGLRSICVHLFELLKSDDLRELALLRLEGYTTAEIAEKLGCTRRTVQRRLKLIEKIWNTQAAME